MSDTVAIEWVFHTDHSKQGTRDIVDSRQASELVRTGRARYAAGDTPAADEPAATDEPAAATATPSAAAIEPATADATAGVTPAATTTAVVEKSAASKAAMPKPTKPTGPAQP
ncbi:hypothetical protein PV646_28805 [Streptomyces sp. ID05-26A]|nr:hypothetical protein [Streptomyces sp. ID05-26A]